MEGRIPHLFAPGTYRRTGKGITHINTVITVTSLKLA